MCLVIYQAKKLIWPKVIGTSNLTGAITKSSMGGKIVDRWRPVIWRFLLFFSIGSKSGLPAGNVVTDFIFYYQICG